MAVFSDGRKLRFTADEWEQQVRPVGDESDESGGKHPRNYPQATGDSPQSGASCPPENGVHPPVCTGYPQEIHRRRRKSVEKGRTK